MAKTVQLLSIIGTVTTETKARIAQLGQIVTQDGFFKGMEKTHAPRFPDEPTAVRLPPESKKVKVTAETVLDAAQKALTKHLDLTLTVDTANAKAKADVIVDGEVLLADVPVNHLMWLHVQLTELAKLLSAIPALDPGKAWTTDGQAAGISRTPSVETPVREKVPGKFVLAEATQYHPAQVQRLDTDEITGYWTQVDFSGALPVQRKEELLARMTTLLEAVQMARQDANTAVAEDKVEGAKIFSYLLGS